VCVCVCVFVCVCVSIHSALGPFVKRHYRHKGAEGRERDAGSGAGCVLRCIGDPPRSRGEATLWFQAVSGGLILVARRGGFIANPCSSPRVDLDPDAISTGIKPSLKTPLSARRVVTGVVGISAHLSRELLVSVWAGTLERAPS
jgi:hypothetical protein